MEDTVPDVAVARAHGVPVLHRSELRPFHCHPSHGGGHRHQRQVHHHRHGLLLRASAGTSVITGGDLRLLQAEGFIGNAWAGASDLLVIEADESDGGVVRYLSRSA